jgi:hypothetical protein
MGGNRLMCTLDNREYEKISTKPIETGTHYDIEQKETIISKLNELKTEYPKYSNIIDDIIDMKTKEVNDDGILIALWLFNIIIEKMIMNKNKEAINGSSRSCRFFRGSKERMGTRIRYNR